MIKILLVDDNPTNLKVLSGAMSDSGWMILVATDGERAIKQAEYATPDLILLDVMMPGIDGFETCYRLKDNPITEEIPVIFMTALNDTVDKVKGLNLGAVDYITKPFQQEEVLARVGVHIRLRSLSKKLIQQNEVLENRVEERTAELTEALNNLQKSQVQLVKNEKMSALGQLVAGVAHEINNPVGFIAGNLSQAEQDIKSLIQMIDCYQEEYPNPAPHVLELSEEIDLEYLKQDVPEMIASMKQGTDRLRNISMSLRTFSRLDDRARVEFNVHEGIDSTLSILKHRLKANEKRPEIKLLRKYGEVPAIKCFPGQLNQAFMNILSNAIDALEESNNGRSYQNIKEKPNQITIRTYLVDADWLAISIGDNGCGMSEEIRAKVFDHLFTTKAVGKGTGLGLSISREIIEDKHQGRLICHSVVGEGTEFTIELPIKLGD